MTSRVYANANGVRRTLLTDHDEPDRFVVHIEQDVEPVLDSIHRDRELMPHNGVNKLIARLPVAIYERAVLEGWDEDDWRRWLNSDEAAPWRIWKGRV